MATSTYMDRQTAINVLTNRKTFLANHPYSSIQDVEAEINAINVAIKDIQRAMLTDSNVSNTGNPWR